MMFYPVCVPRNVYRGGDIRRQRKRDEYNRIATRVEAYLNDDLLKRPEHFVGAYMSYEIAQVLGENASIVQRIVYGIDAGSGGVTICKGNLDRALGLELMRAESKPS